MDTAIRKRRGLKGKLTRLEGNVGGPNNPPLDDRLVERYQQQLDQHWSELNDLHEEIGTHCDDAEFAIHQVEFDQLAARIEALQLRMPAAGADRRRSDEGTTGNGPAPNRSETTVRLPRLDLPTFSGNLHEWTSFHDLFSATIHGNEQLAGSQKLQYLKAALRGEAATLIQSIQITDNNFAEAWDILMQRYHNKREIINAHLKRLCSQPTVNSESPAALRKLIDSTNETVRALRVLEVPVEHWDLILIHLVSQRLDHDSRRQWELTVNSTEVESYSEFMAYLEKRARALLTCPGPQNTNKGAAPYQRSTLMSDRRYPAKAAFYADASEQDCRICRGDHHISQCHELLQSSIEDRRALVKEHGLCYNCLSGDHSWRRCKAGSCKRCNGKHHTLLHQSTNPELNDQSQTTAIDISSNVSRVICQREQTIPKTLLMAGSATYKCEQPFPEVLLATALVSIRDARGNQKVCRAMLDSGSQATFITEECAQRLQLPRQRASVGISSIGDSNVIVSRGSVNIGVSSCTQRSQEMCINAIVLKQVTGITPAAPLDTSSWTHIPDFQLADPNYHQPNKIDVLLGADVLAESLRDGLRRGSKGTPTAQNTCFGWVVSGQTRSAQGTTQVLVNTAQIHPNTALQRIREAVNTSTTKVLSTKEGADSTKADFKSPIPRNQGVTDEAVTVPLVNVETREANVQVSVAAKHRRHVRGNRNHDNRATKVINLNKAKSRVLRRKAPEWSVSTTSMNRTEKDREMDKQVSQQMQTAVFVFHLIRNYRAAELRRLQSKRGHVGSEIRSEHGIKFEDASNEFKTLQQLLSSKKQNQTITKVQGGQGIFEDL